MTAKILYVEDNDDNIYMLQSRLERGLEVLVARDGARGRGARREAAGPDPDGSGPAGAGRLGGRAAAQGAPETRAYPDDRAVGPRDGGDREQALEAGCDDYDTKPVESPRLLAKIQALLPDGRRS